MHHDITIIGHRGARAEAPENTLAGIKHCLNMGVVDFEVDIRLSRDEHFFLMHDASLQRTCQQDDYLHILNSTALSSIKTNQDITASYLTSFNEHDLTIPSLDALLALAEKNQKPCSFQLEIKSDEHTDSDLIANKIISCFTPEKINRIKSQLYFTSFNTDIIRDLHQKAPHLALGVIADSDPINAINLASKYDCSLCCLHYELLLDAEPTLKEKIQQTELKVSVWTLNDPSKTKALQMIGVSSIITDVPSQFLK